MTSESVTARPFFLRIPGEDEHPADGARLFRSPPKEARNANGF
ncbi:MAG TPA: hypothetical protein VGF45_04610 [Polyangia bacterium]